MKIEVIMHGMFDSNGYLLMDKEEAVLIDSGVPSDDVINILKENNVKLKYILLTHGHIDHICTVDELRIATGAKVLIHKEDSECLTNADLNLSSGFMNSCIYKKADMELVEGDEIEFGSVKIKVIHTPGHSKGGCCYIADEVLFSGDTLFSGSIGRTDLHGGDFNELINSIKEKLFILPMDTKVYPGHGAYTTIGNEIKYNPYLR